MSRSKARSPLETAHEVFWWIRQSCCRENFAKEKSPWERALSCLHQDQTQGSRLRRRHSPNTYCLTRETGREIPRTSPRTSQTICSIGIVRFSDFGHPPLPFLLTWTFTFWLVVFHRTPRGCIGYCFKDSAGNHTTRKPK